MKRKIRLTESQLHNLINECVMSILEAHGQGLSYATAKSAYNKMLDLGQTERASQLDKTYSEVNDDDDAQYDLKYDSIYFNDRDNSGPGTGYFSNGAPRSTVETPRTLRRRTREHEYDAEHTDPAKFIPASVRTNDPASAKRRAQHLNNFYGKQKFNKNDFRA